MPVMDEFKEERETLKHAPFSKKLAYFWDYYKWQVVIGTVLIISAISLISNFVNRKETAFYTVLINGAATPVGEKVAADFGTFCEIDDSKEEMIFDTSAHMDLTTMDDATVNTAQKLLVYISAGDVDSILTDKNSIENYAYLGLLYDLRKLLTAEEINKYQDFFYYVDQSIVDAKKAASDNFDYDTEFEIPQNPYDPQSMKEPIPVAIHLIENPMIEPCFLFPDNKQVVVGFFVNTKHPDTCHKLLEYLSQTDSEILKAQ